jgi:hypothetical protein
MTEASNPDRIGPVEFVPRGFRRLVVILGAVEIGEICEVDAARGVRAWWRLCLPGVTSAPTPRYSLAEAKRQVAERASEWLDAAGLTIVRSSAPVPTIEARAGARAQA